MHVLSCVQSFLGIRTLHSRRFDDLPCRWEEALAPDGMSIDPDIAAYRAGVTVVLADLPRQERGRMFLSPIYGTADILVSDDLPSVEQRLTCAQLLGVHLCVDPFRVDIGHVVLTGDRLGMGPDHEGRAWSFAGRLLMPKALVSDVYRTSRDGREVAEKMRVPQKLAAGRMRRLGVGTGCSSKPVSEDTT